MKSHKGYIFVLLSVFSNFISQIQFNYVSKNIINQQNINFQNINNIITILITNLSFIYGVLFFGLSAIFWLIALKRMILSSAYTLTSINYILITIYSVLILHENLNWQKTISSLLIFIGIIIMSLGYRKEKV